MAENSIGHLINTLAGGSSFRVVNDLTGAVALTNIGVKDVRFNFHSQLMQNTGEDGLPIIDSRVIFPTTITMNVFCNSADRVAEVNTLLNDISSKFTITSRGILLENFMLDTESMTQAAAMISANPMKISFKQVMLQGGGALVCRNPGDSSTVLGGIRNSIKVAESAVEDLTSKLLAASSEIFG